jgi:Tfp pilus assembly protein PilV
MSKRKNIKGFTIVEALLALIFIALIVLIGLYVVHNHNSSNSNKSNNATTTATKPTQTPKATDPYAGWKIYTSTTEKATFKYPANWTVTKDPSEDKVSISSPSGSVIVSWKTGIQGIGGACDSDTPIGSESPQNLSLCPQFDVIGKTAISGASGLYVVTSSATTDNDVFYSWMAVQNSKGILTSQRNMGYSFYEGKNSVGLVELSMLGSDDSAPGPSFSSEAQAKAFFNGTEAKQAKLILLSLTY